MSYAKTRDALALYDVEPTRGSADLVQVAFWMEAPTTIRGRWPQTPTVEQIRAIVMPSAEHRAPNGLPIDGYPLQAE